MSEAINKVTSVLPNMNSCFHCLSLRTGSLIVAWYYFVTGSLANFYALSITPELYQYPYVIFKSGDIGPRLARCLYLVYFYFIIAIVICVWRLLIGINKKRPKSFLPFLVAIPLFVSYGIIVLLLILFTSIRTDLKNLYIDSGFTYLAPFNDPVLRVTWFLDPGVAVYCFFVVKSHYQELKQMSSPIGGGV